MTSFYRPSIARVPEMELIADKMWGMSGLTPQDVDAAVIYDAFSSIVLFQLEAFGFCDFPADFTVPDLDAPERRYAGAAVLSEDALIIFGGKTDCGQVNDVWTWDLDDQSWTERSDATAGEVCERTFADPEGCESLCF